MFEELTWFIPILKKTNDPKYLNKFRDAAGKFVNAHRELFDGPRPQADLGGDDGTAEGRELAARIAAAVREGDEPFTDGSVVRWLTLLNEIDIRNARRDMAAITVRSYSGYCLPEYAYRDEIIVSRDRIRYTYEPDSPSDQNPPRNWSFGLSGPAQREIWEDLVTAVIEILHRGAVSGMFDIGTKEFIVAYADGTEEERTFFQPEFCFAECFALIKKLLPPGEPVPAGIRSRDDDA